MWSAFSRGRWRRGAVLLLMGLVGVLAAPHAQAVVLYSSADRNTTAPSEDEGLDAWNIEATWGYFLATPIDATHFVASKHVGVASSVVVLNGVTYQVNTSSGVMDPDSDLEIFTLSKGYSFSSWAPLYISAVDGSEIGQTLTVIGRGTQRGSAVTVDGVTKGWIWGDSDGVKSWGQNVVSGLVGYSPTTPNNSLLYFNFDSDGISNEAALSAGDSCGGAFIYANGKWKLIGVNYGIDSPWSYTGGTADSGFIADIFDARGLYYKDDNSQWVLAAGTAAMPGASYASDISSRIIWVEAAIHGTLSGDANQDGTVNGADLNTELSNFDKTIPEGVDGWSLGDFNADGTVNGADLNIVLSNFNRTYASAEAAVPEPGDLVILGSGGAFALFAGWLRRRELRG